ncbi:MAG: Response regulator containing a CheY-like receiver domain and an DNA-binding domain [Firmicutes bacterium]|nr:Response regulator containing a CheY-like receiver domain and an DNA-binding domain [Bacillota bacterium]
MKKLLIKLLVILFYLFILLYITGFDLLLLFDVKLLTLTIIGTVILSLPYYQKELSNNDILHILGKNALVAGYLEAFLFLFVRLNDTEGFSDLLPDIALNCRPALYGFILFITLRRDENKQTTGDKLTEQETSVIVLSMEEQDRKWRDMGLTMREVEIARLIRNGYSNHEIAEELVISETTVKKHISNIFGKLQITKREQMKVIIQKEIQ